MSAFQPIMPPVDPEHRREWLGRLVRATWVAYCCSIGDFKPSHLAAYDDLSEVDKEADRQIGESVWEAAVLYLGDADREADSGNDDPGDRAVRRQQ